MLTASASGIITIAPIENRTMASKASSTGPPELLPVMAIPLPIASVTTVMPLVNDATMADAAILAAAPAIPRIVVLFTYPSSWPFAR